MIALLLSLLAAGAEQVPPEFVRAPACHSATATIDEPCVLQGRMDSALARKRLGKKDYVWWIEGDRLTMVARPTLKPWAMLCCSVQTALEPIMGTDLAGITIRVPRLEEAILSIRPFPSGAGAADVLRGPLAPPAPRRVAPSANHLTTIPIHSIWLGQTRHISIYLPPNIAPNERLPVFYLADDLTIQFAPILEAAILNGTIRPAILVGLGSAPSALGNCKETGCDQRGLEYKLDRNHGDASADSPYGRHLRFVTQEVMPYIESHYPASVKREDHIVGGTSNGGDWALSAASLRPNLFGKVMTLSSSGKSGKLLGEQLKNDKIYGAAGLYEPDFLGYTRDAVSAAHAAGATTKFRLIVGGHDPLTWDVLFADAAAWLLNDEKGES